MQDPGMVPQDFPGSNLSDASSILPTAPHSYLMLFPRDSQFWFLIEISGASAGDTAK